MATDQSLATLLRAIQAASNDQDISSLFGSAASLLTILSNPLNISLLSSQLLCAPTIWDRPDGNRTALRMLSIFNSATATMLQQGDDLDKRKGFALQSNLAKGDWVQAVVRGADEKSPRWRHLLLLGGVLLGCGRCNRQAIPAMLRKKLENAMTKALNFALGEVSEDSDLAINTIVITTNYVFSHLSDTEKNRIEYDLLLPLLCWALFFSSDGLHFGYFLSKMDAHIEEGSDQKFNWSSQSPSFYEIQQMANGPIIASLGSLSRLIAHSVEHLRNVGLLAALIGDIAAFSRSLGIQWRQNKLSEIDAHEEMGFLGDESLQTSLPLLWRTLKSTMFCIVTILNPLLSRVLADRQIAIDDAPILASQALQILRNLHFISSRSGANAFSQYAFVYYAAIDILSQYPVQAEAFLQDIRPAEIGAIPQHPLDRCHDLYFLNTAEHFPLMLTPQGNEQLLIRAAMPYLGVGGDQRLLETFEAAHSVMLAVFLAPQNVELVISHVRPYINALFQVFPHNLSSRQFRMAVKTLIRVTSWPSVVAERESILSSELLEIIHQRLEAAPSRPLERTSDRLETETASPGGPILSEQAVMVLTLIDTLPYLNPDILEEWLYRAAISVNSIGDEGLKQVCRERFWEVLSGGEMDVDRAALSVAWWTTKGGRDIVVDGTDEADKFLMRGGLREQSKL